jgi:hypothetical protein
LEILNGAGTSLMTIASSGNVGIGTTVPREKLDVRMSRSSGSNVNSLVLSDNVTGAQTAGFGSRILGYSNGTSAVSAIGFEAGGTGTNNETELGFYTQNAASALTRQMTITSTGFIGIGTTTANSKLTVNAGGIRFTGTGAFGSGNDAGLYGGGSAAGNPSLYLVANGNVTETIASTGNVGIGTTNPAAQLSVQGTGQTAANFSTTGNLGGALYVGDTGVSVGNGGAVVFGANASAWRFAAIKGYATDGSNNSLGDLVFSTRRVSTDSALTEAMRILSTGNIGIGTTNPTVALQVGGRIYASSSAAVIEALNSSVGVAALNVTTYTKPALLSLTSAGAVNDLLINPEGSTVTIGTTSPGSDQFNVKTGTNTFAARFINSGNTISAKGVAIQAGRIDTTGTNHLIDFFNGDASSNVGNITFSGTTTTYGTTSDRRLKENIASTSEGIDTLMQIRVKDFNFISDPTKTTVQGFIAQDLYEVYPEAVIVGGDNPHTNPWNVDYGRLTPLLVQAIQDEQREVSSQSFAITDLQTRVASLSVSLDQLLANSTSGSYSNISITSGSGPVDVLAAIAQAVLVKVQNIWASGDVIAQGLKKTYFATTDMLGSAYGTISDLAANWSSRSITIANNADDATKSLFSGNAAQAADQSKTDLGENGNYLATYGVDSTRGEIQLSGTSQIVNGEARIFFDYSFSSIISSSTPIKVILTPTSAMQGQLYVDTKNPYGFVVKELNNQDVSGTFDWLVIARRKGLDDVTVSPTPAPTIVAPSDNSTPASSSATVSPTPTPTDSPAPSDTPTSTPAPTDTPTPAPSDTPAPTPAPSDTPASTPTP